MIASKARISAFGAYVPEKRLTDHDLEKMVDTSDEWIIQRTGIRDRYISTKKEFSSGYGYQSHRKSCYKLRKTNPGC